jgi:hypothetical protein
MAESGKAELEFEVDTLVFIMLLRGCQVIPHTAHVTMREAKERRRIWGGKPCSHPELEQERDDIGTSTGDYVCTRCGEARWGSHWNEPAETDPARPAD